MPSDVGKQAQEIDVIQHAVALELDCVASFTEAAERIEGGAEHEGFTRLAAECVEHARTWQQRLRELGGAAAAPNRVSTWLNRMKVQVVAPFGRKAIAFAVTNNPADCITAYNRVRLREDLPVITRELASQMLDDASTQREVVRKARY